MTNSDEQPFEWQWSEPARLMLVTFPMGFDHSQWGRFEAFYREQLLKNVVHWRLDLSGMVTLDTLLLGLIVGLNAVLSARNGALTIVARRRTPAADLIEASKINRIIEVEMV